MILVHGYHPNLKERDLKGGKPLPLCSFCASLNIEAPTKSSRPNQFEKKQQADAEKERAHKRVVSKGLKKKLPRRNRKEVKKCLLGEWKVNGGCIVS